MKVMSTYKNLEIEIDVLRLRIDELNRRKYRLSRDVWHKHIDLEIYNKEMNSIDNTLKSLDATLEDMRTTRDDMKRKLKELEGIEQQILYKKIIEGKSLLEISLELGYSYDWIREVHAKSKRRVKGSKQPTMTPQHNVK